MATEGASPPGPAPRMLGPACPRRATIKQLIPSPPPLIADKSLHVDLGTFPARVTAAPAVAVGWPRPGCSAARRFRRPARLRRGERVIRTMPFPALFRGRAWRSGQDHVAGRRFSADGHGDAGAVSALRRAPAVGGQLDWRGGRRSANDAARPVPGTAPGTSITPVPARVRRETGARWRCWPRSRPAGARVSASQDSVAPGAGSSGNGPPGPPPDRRRPLQVCRDMSLTDGFSPPKSRGHDGAGPPCPGRPAFRWPISAVTGAKVPQRFGPALPRGRPARRSGPCNLRVVQRPIGPCGDVSRSGFVQRPRPTPASNRRAPAVTTDSGPAPCTPDSPAGPARTCRSPRVRLHRQRQCMPAVSPPGAPSFGGHLMCTGRELCATTARARPG